VLAAVNKAPAKHIQPSGLLIVFLVMAQNSVGKPNHPNLGQEGHASQKHCCHLGHTMGPHRTADACQCADFNTTQPHPILAEGRVQIFVAASSLSLQMSKI